MHDRLQFGMRENPASDRRHGSRFPVNDPANATSVAEAEPDNRAPSRSPNQADASANDIQYAAQYHAATDEKTQEKIERGTMGTDSIRKATPQQTHRRSATQEPAANGSESPRLLACLLILPTDAESIVTLLRNLAASLPCTAAFPLVAGADSAKATDDPWLNHEEAADYLGISRSTLYQYGSQRKIECRKLGGRLEYLRSTLDQFKDQQIRPTHRCLTRGSIIPTALGSGK
jgi:excisionase family DNA binding protein